MSRHGAPSDRPRPNTGPLAFPVTLDAKNPLWCGPLTLFGLSRWLNARGEVFPGEGFPYDEVKWRVVSCYTNRVFRSLARRPKPFPIALQYFPFPPSTSQPTILQPNLYNSFTKPINLSNQLNQSNSAHPILTHPTNIILSGAPGCLEAARGAGAAPLPKDARRPAAGGLAAVSARASVAPVLSGGALTTSYRGSTTITTSTPE